MKKITAEKRAAKANRKVGKALSVFTKAADELELAGDHHFLNEDELYAAAHAAEQAAAALRAQAAVEAEQGYRVLDHADRIRTLATI